MVQLHFDCLEVVIMVIATSEFVGKFPAVFQCESNICDLCVSAFEVKALPTDDPKVAAAFQAIKDGWSDEWTSKKMECTQYVWQNHLLHVGDVMLLYSRSYDFTIYNIYHIIIYRYNYLYVY